MKHPDFLAICRMTRNPQAEIFIHDFKQRHFSAKILPIIVYHAYLMRRPLKKPDIDITHFMAMPENKNLVLDYFYKEPTDNISHRSILPRPIYKDGLVQQTYSIYSMRIVPVTALTDMILKYIIDVKNLFDTLAEDFEKISNTIANESIRSNRNDLNEKGTSLLNNAKNKFIEKMHACLSVMSNTCASFDLNKKRFKSILDRTQLLKIVIIESKTEDEQDLTFLKHMEKADQLIRNLMLCHLKTFEVKKEGEYFTNLDLHLVHPASSGDEFLCQHNSHTSGEAELFAVLNIFMNLEQQYDCFYKLRFKALYDLRMKNKMDTAARTVTPAYKALQASPSSSSASSSASPHVEASHEIDKKPKRYQQSSEPKALHAAIPPMKNVRTFAGIKLDTSLVATIRKSSCTQYFYMDLIALADDAIDIANFIDIPVKFAAENGDTGLKHIGKHEVNCNINGVVHTLDASYELKQKHNQDRILVVQIPCDQKDSHESLFVGFIGLPGGLHDGDKLKLDPNKVYAISPPECSQLNIEAFTPKKASFDVKNN